MVECVLGNDSFDFDTKASFSPEAPLLGQSDWGEGTNTLKITWFIRLRFEATNRCRQSQKKTSAFLRQWCHHDGPFSCSIPSKCLENCTFSLCNEFVKLVAHTRPLAWQVWNFMCQRNCDREAPLFGIHCGLTVTNGQRLQPHGKMGHIFSMLSGWQQWSLVYYVGHKRSVRSSSRARRVKCSVSPGLGWYKI